MSDDPPLEERAREFSDLRMSRLKMFWSESWSGLSKGLLISVVLHFLLALPLFFTPRMDTDLDMQWHGQFAELAGIGHGDEDFDDTEEVDWDEIQDFDLESEDQQDELDETETTDDDESPDDERTDEDEPADDEDEPADDETAHDDDDEEEVEPAEDDEIDEDQPDGPGPDPDPETDPVAASEPDQSEDSDPDESPSFETLPGIDRSSPSNLPDLRHYGPGNARVTGLVRTDRFRGTDLEPYVDDLLRAVPDYYIALEGIDLDPIEEFDSIFMASANPDHLHDTFLAVRHRFETDELQDLLDRRFTDEMEWEIDGDRPLRRLVPQTGRYYDPRRLLLANPGLALIGQPTWFEDILDDVDPDSELGRELAESESGPSTFALLDGLSRIEEVAEDDDTLVLFSAYGFRLKKIPMVDRIPPFDAARLAIRDAETPRLTIDLLLGSEREARQLERDCPRLRSQLTMVLRFMGIADLVRPLECSRDGNYVIIEGEYTSQQIMTLLDRAGPMIEAIHPPSLGHLPGAPETADVDPDGDAQQDRLPVDDLETQDSDTGIDADPQGDRSADPEPDTRD